MMETFADIVTIVKGIEFILAFLIIPLFAFVCNVARGVKCQLRSDMLHIYYNHRESKKIRQYELENFIFLYKAYKALRGNSFIDKIHKEVLTWEVIT
jgi:hypothetical protein